LVSGPALAQDSNREVGTISGKGNRILPKQGDFAFGVELNPLFDYIGNMFNAKSDNYAPSFEGIDFAINGKYFLTDNQAIRIRLLMDLGQVRYKNIVQDDATIAVNPEAVDPTVYDVYKKSENEFGFSVGYEFRRGYGRLQGFWGAEAYLGFTKAKGVFEYGNAMTGANPTPTTTYGWGTSSMSSSPADYRSINTKSSSFSAGAGLFAGVEYFIAPKMSIGAELNFRLLYSWYGEIKAENEQFDYASGIVLIEKDRRMPNVNSKFTVATKPGGALFMTFYF
jgi:hypothetical protein